MNGDPSDPVTAPSPEREPDVAPEAAPAPAPTASAPSTSGLLVGRMVNGKYDVQAVVAAGGMGKIYRAEQQPLGRIVALKVLHARAGQSLVSTGATPGTGGDTLFKKRFFREASILARLQHPNIVTVFDYGKIDGLPADDEQFFMAMEYLSGETLQQRIAARGPLPVDEVLRIARQVGRGLREAHGNGIVHRDLKPSNVMIGSGRDGEDLVKILDFGIVKLTAEDDKTQELTQEGLFIGSPKYMAPEQISNGTIDVRTDIYSLGVILYQCLTGKVPFEAETSIQIMMAHLNQVAPTLREKAPDVATPEWLDALVMSCLEKDADKRPATVEELLRRMAEGVGLGSHPSLGVHVASTARSGVTSPFATASASGSGAPPATARTGPVSASVASLTARAAGDGATETSAAASLPSEPPLPSGHRELARRNTMLLVAVAVAACVAIGSAAMLRARSRPAEAARPIETATATAQVVAPKRLFEVSIESLPAGAEVEEDGKSLGTTPLRVTFDNDAARTNPRHLVVRHDGFQPFVIVQGPSADDARIVATLVPTAAAAPAVAAVASGAAPSPRPPAPRKPVASADKPHAPPAPPPSPSGLDIRPTR